MNDYEPLITPKVRSFLQTKRSHSVGMVLSYDDVAKPGSRRTRGGRGTDAYTWSLAAWATCRGLNPTVTWRNAKNEQLRCSPFVSISAARQYLDLRAADPIYGGNARMLLRDLNDDIRWNLTDKGYAAIGVVPPAPRLPRQEEKALLFGERYANEDPDFPCTCATGRFGVIRMPYAFDVVDRSGNNARGGYIRIRRFTGKTSRDSAHRLAHKLQREHSEAQSNE